MKVFLRASPPHNTSPLLLIQLPSPLPFPARPTSQPHLPSPKQTPSHHNFLSAALAALLPLLQACSWKIHPPAHLTQPVPVFLTEYGYHTRLALPAQSGAHFVEFGFGEWHYYGLERHGPLDGVRALIGLGQGALSRREIPASHTGLMHTHAAGGQRSAAILVEKTHAQALLRSLESRWQQNSHTIVIRSQDHIPVSRDPNTYHLFSNSNRATALWLREMGCEIRGFPLLSNFVLLPPSPRLR